MVGLAHDEARNALDVDCQIITSLDVWKLLLEVFNRIDEY